MDSPLIEGWKLDIEKDCATTQPANCLTFVSSTSQIGNTQRFSGSTTTLSQNQRCRVKVDATSEVAHIKFYDTSNSLGVLYPGYILG